MVSDRWWYFNLLSYFVSQENTKGIALPQICDAFRNGKKLFSQNTPDDSACETSPTCQRNPPNHHHRRLLMTLGKFLSVHLLGNQFNLETVNKILWPNLRKKKTCISLEHCSVLFSISCLTVTNHGYVRDVSENICLNQLKNPQQNKPTW